MNDEKWFVMFGRIRVPDMIHIKQCRTPEDYTLAKKLVDAYIRWLDIDLSFQNIDNELDTFESMYGEPEGVFLIAFNNNALAGGVGMRKWGHRICEMKRLYVYGDQAGHGVGRKLCESVIAVSKALGYQKMRLDTLPGMQRAYQLYRQFGFTEIAPYRVNPHAGAKYLELVLSR